MIVNVYAARDNAVDAFLPPFYARARGEAIRSFLDIFKQADHQFSQNPGDYTLYELGSFDDASGRFTSIEPVRLLSGLEVAQRASSTPS